MPNKHDSYKEKMADSGELQAGAGVCGAPLSWRKQHMALHQTLFQVVLLFSNLSSPGCLPSRPGCAEMCFDKLSS